jgi:hypothetical protein
MTDELRDRVEPSRGVVGSMAVDVVAGVCNNAGIGLRYEEEPVKHINNTWLE